jgi:hypothetical protein
MPIHPTTTLQVESILGLRTLTESARLEIRLADAEGNEHVLSVPRPVAVELARFIADVAGLLDELEKRPDPLA